jgi:hypothetical protein
VIQGVATDRPVPLPNSPDDPATDAMLERVCRSLGFVSRRQDDLACTIWSSPAGFHLVVTFGGPTAIRRIGEGARLRDAMLARIDARTRDDLTCLVVVPDTSNWQALERAVAVRHAAEYVRGVTLGALAALVELVEAGALTHRQAIMVLRPPGPFADAVVALIAAVGLGVSRAQALLNPPLPPPARHTREESATAPATVRRGSKPEEAFRP